MGSISHCCRWYKASLSNSTTQKSQSNLPLLRASLLRLRHRSCGSQTGPQYSASDCWLLISLSWRTTKKLIFFRVMLPSCNLSKIYVFTIFTKSSLDEVVLRGAVEHRTVLLRSWWCGDVAATFEERVLAILLASLSAFHVFLWKIRRDNLYGFSDKPSYVLK